MKKLFVFLLLLILLPFVSHAQIWEGEGGSHIQEGESDESSLLSEYIQEGIGLSGSSPTPSPVPTNLVYGFRIKQLYDEYYQEDNLVEYTDDAIGMTPVASETTNDGVIINLGSWETWINNHFTPVMLKSDGTEDYELSRTNQNYRADGVTSSDIANTSYDGNAMVRVKKFYISVSAENADGTPADNPGQSYIHVKICDEKKDNSYTCYGFIDSEGNECDYAYYSMYEGSLIDDKLRSISGQSVYSSDYTATESMILAARANGNGWNIDNIALYNAVRMAHVLVDCYIGTENIYGAGGGNSKHNTGMNDDNTGFVYTYYQSVGSVKNFKTCWIENFFGGYSWNLVNGLYIYNSTGSNAVATFSYKLQEPYNDISLFAKTNLPYIKKINNYSYTSVNIPIDNLLLPRGGTLDVNSIGSVETDYGYSKDFVGIAGTKYRDNVMAGVGGSMRYLGAVAIGMFAVSNASTLADNVKARLTYLPQPPSLAQHYQTNSVNTLSTLSMPRNNLLQIQPVEVEEEPMNIISTETMEVTE